MCSRGSVIPLLIDQIKSGNPITITGGSMTHFIMSLDEVVDLALFAHAIDMVDFYRTLCEKCGLNYDKYFNKGYAERNTLTEFNSNNTKILTMAETKEKIVSFAYI